MYPDLDGHAASSNGTGPVTCLPRSRTLRVFGFGRDAPSAVQAGARGTPVRSHLVFASVLGVRGGPDRPPSGHTGRLPNCRLSHGLRRVQSKLAQIVDDTSSGGRRVRSPRWGCRATQERVR